MTNLGQCQSICPHCLEEVLLPPDGWLPPWVCSSCGGLYGKGRDRLFKVPSDFKPIRFLMTYQQAHYWAHFNAGCMSYVYALCYPTGLPFYVGKGTGKRLITHGKFVGQREPRDEKEEVIAYLQSIGLYECYAILVLDATSDDAMTEEAKIIMQCGRRGNGGMLTNRDEGYLVNEPATWEIPEQPELYALCVNPNHWVIHPEIPFRKPTYKESVAVYCPACKYRCSHPLGVKFEEVRCPNCFKGWSVNPDSVMALYRSEFLAQKERSKQQEQERLIKREKLVEQPKPKPILLPVKIDQSALATQDRPVEEAVAQLVNATIAEKPTVIVKEEKQSFALAFFLFGVVFALALSLFIAIAVM